MRMPILETSSEKKYEKLTTDIGKSQEFLSELSTKLLQTWEKVSKISATSRTAVENNHKNGTD